MSIKERAEKFPTQLLLTVLWATVGTAVSIILSSSILWVSLISIYAITVSHFTAHIAWQTKQQEGTDIKEVKDILKEDKT